MILADHEGFWFYGEMQEELEGWLKELRLWGEGAERFRFEECEGGQDEQDRGRLTFCTSRNTYYVSFSDDYLGCIVSSRITRPGETWLRGNDLPDGKFTRETWDKILNGIFAYELVPLDSPVRSPEITPPEGVGSVGRGG